MSEEYPFRRANMIILESERKLLRRLGWDDTTAPGQGYICRICHKECTYGTDVWKSPQYSFYHSSCAEKSPAFLKALKRILA